MEALERRIYGLSPWGYQLDSLLLYALRCALAAGVAHAVSRRRDVGVFAGCFFAVAPVHTEVVAAITLRPSRRKLGRRSPSAAPPALLPCASRPLPCFFRTTRSP